MRILTAIAVLSVGLIPTACGDTDASDIASAEATTTTSIAPSVPRTTTTPKPVTDYDRWAAAYRPYAGAGDVNQRVFEFQQSLCTTLRNGGQEAIGTFPAQSPAEYLREGWGVGLTDTNAGLALKGEVAEKVIIQCCAQTSLG
ncbi:hypothetical protein BJF84_14800 [Rhodococcus sp. CUA-806]|nr:hypothetical protein BJF84_14800 [Rhodococcus sp. CUA-806]